MILLVPLPFLAVFEIWLVFVMLVLTGNEIIFEQLIDDLRLEKESPLLILQVCLFGHSGCRSFRDHAFDSLWVQTIENLPEEVPYWVTLRFPVEQMLSDSFPFKDLGQDILNGKLCPVRN